MSDFNEKVTAFSEILHKFNKIHSLTNYKDIQAQVQDSIKPLEFLNLEPKIAIDVGSGAGFPAVFLAMKMSNCEWHLFEPNLKKASFLNYVKVELDIKNVKIHTQKIELCDKFIVELITSRALTNISNLVKICNGFYDKNTHFLLYKGSKVDTEIGDFNAKIFNDKNRNYVLMDNVC